MTQFRNSHLRKNSFHSKRSKLQYLHDPARQPVNFPRFPFDYFSPPGANMWKLFSISLGVMLALFVSGCAHTPSVVITYNLAKSDVRFKVIRTVSCDKNDVPVIATAVTPMVTHSADKMLLQSVSLRDLRGPFSDSDAKFGFYDDGRLKEFNAVSTGQGEAILKTAISIADIIAFDGTTYPDACKLIAKAGGEKPISLVYEGTVLTDTRDAQDVPPDAPSSFYANDERVASAIGHICAVVEETSSGTVPLKDDPSTAGARLKAKQPGSAKIRIAVTRGGKCSSLPLWNGNLSVAQLGTMYDLPIPSPKAFGKQSFSVTFAESGALTTVQYATTASAVSALNATNSIFAATKPDSAAQRAADIKAEADLIFQQQRLVACRADKASCK
jgi:hypothetical protein